MFFVGFSKFHSRRPVGTPAPNSTRAIPVNKVILPYLPRFEARWCGESQYAPVLVGDFNLIGIAGVRRRIIFFAEVKFFPGEDNGETASQGHNHSFIGWRNPIRCDCKATKINYLQSIYWLPPSLIVIRKRVHPTTPMLPNLPVRVYALLCILCMIIYIKNVFERC